MQILSSHLIKSFHGSLPTGWKFHLTTQVYDHLHRLICLSNHSLGIPWEISWWRIPLQYRRPQFDSCVRKTHWRRDRLPTPVFWPREFSPWGHKESDMTERLLLWASASNQQQTSVYRHQGIETFKKNTAKEEAKLMDHLIPLRI